MPTYYIFRENPDPKVLGIKNGIKQADIVRSGFKNPEKFDVLKDLLGTNKYWEIKDNVPRMDFEVQCVRTLPKAKLTDFLQFGPVLLNCPYLISEKVLAIFSRHSIPGHTIFPATVDHQGKLHEYRLFHIAPSSDDIVDFSKSIFYTGSELVGKTYQTFDSAADKMDFTKNNVGLKAEHIYLNEKFDLATDLFVLKGGETVVSERLKDELEDFSACSGIKFLPAFGDVRWPTVTGPQ